MEDTKYQKLMKYIADEFWANSIFNKVVQSSKTDNEIIPTNITHMDIFAFEANMDNNRLDFVVSALAHEVDIRLIHQLEEMIDLSTSPQPCIDAKKFDDEFTYQISEKMVEQLYNIAKENNTKYILATPDCNALLVNSKRYKSAPLWSCITSGKLGLLEDIPVYIDVYSKGNKAYCIADAKAEYNDSFVFELQGDQAVIKTDITVKDVSGTVFNIVNWFTNKGNK